MYMYRTWAVIASIQRYLWLDDPGIDCRWWRDIPHLFRSTLWLSQLLTKWKQDLFARGKVAGVWL
jgi:hypothetical protein